MNKTQNNSKIVNNIIENNENATNAEWDLKKLNENIFNIDDGTDEPVVLYHVDNNQDIIIQNNNENIDFVENKKLLQNFEKKNKLIKNKIFLKNFNNPSFFKDKIHLLLVFILLILFLIFWIASNQYFLNILKFNKNKIENLNSFKLIKINSDSCNINFELLKNSKDNSYYELIRNDNYNNDKYSVKKNNDQISIDIVYEKLLNDNCSLNLYFNKNDRFSLSIKSYNSLIYLNNDQLNLNNFNLSGNNIIMKFNDLVIHDTLKFDLNYAIISLKNLKFSNYKENSIWVNNGSINIRILNNLNLTYSKNNICILTNQYSENNFLKNIYLGNDKYVKFNINIKKGPLTLLHSSNDIVKNNNWISNFYINHTYSFENEFLNILNNLNININNNDILINIQNMDNGIWLVTKNLDFSFLNNFFFLNYIYFYSITKLVRIRTYLKTPSCLSNNTNEINFNIKNALNRLVEQKFKNTKLKVFNIISPDFNIISNKERLPSLTNNWLFRFYNLMNSYAFEIANNLSNFRFLFDLDFINEDNYILKFYIFFFILIVFYFYLYVIYIIRATKYIKKKNKSIFIINYIFNKIYNLNEENFELEKKKKLIWDNFNNYFEKTYVNILNMFDIFLYKIYINRTSSLKWFLMNISNNYDKNKKKIKFDKLFLNDFKKIYELFCLKFNLPQQDLHLDSTIKILKQYSIIIEKEKRTDYIIKNCKFNFKNPKKLFFNENDSLEFFILECIEIKFKESIYYDDFLKKYNEFCDKYNLNKSRINIKILETKYSLKLINKFDSFWKLNLNLNSRYILNNDKYNNLIYKLKFNDIKDIVLIKKIDYIFYIFLYFLSIFIFFFILVFNINTIFDVKIYIYYLYWYSIRNLGDFSYTYFVSKLYNSINGDAHLLVLNIIKNFLLIFIFIYSFMKFLKKKIIIYKFDSMFKNNFSRLFYLFIDILLIIFLSISTINFIYISIYWIDFINLYQNYIILIIIVTIIFIIMNIKLYLRSIDKIKIKTLKNLIKHDQNYIINTVENKIIYILKAQKNQLENKLKIFKKFNNKLEEKINKIYEILKSNFKLNKEDAFFIIDIVFYQNKNNIVNYINKVEYFSDKTLDYQIYNFFNESNEWDREDLKFKFFEILLNVTSFRIIEKEDIIIKDSKKDLNVTIFKLIIEMISNFKLNKKKFSNKLPKIIFLVTKNTFTNEDDEINRIYLFFKFVFRTNFIFKSNKINCNDIVFDIFENKIEIKNCIEFLLLNFEKNRQNTLIFSSNNNLKFIDLYRSFNKLEHINNNISYNYLNKILYLKLYDKESQLVINKVNDLHNVIFNSKNLFKKSNDDIFIKNYFKYLDSELEFNKFIIEVKNSDVSLYFNFKFKNKKLYKALFSFIKKDFYNNKFIIEIISQQFNNVYKFKKFIKIFTCLLFEDNLYNLSYLYLKVLKFKFLNIFLAIKNLKFNKDLLDKEFEFIKNILNIEFSEFKSGKFKKKLLISFCLKQKNKNLLSEVILITILVFKRININILSLIEYIIDNKKINNYEFEKIKENIDYLLNLKYDKNTNEIIIKYFNFMDYKKDLKLVIYFLDIFKIEKLNTSTYKSMLINNIKNNLKIDINYNLYNFEIDKIKSNISNKMPYDFLLNLYYNDLYLKNEFEFFLYKLWKSKFNNDENLMKSINFIICIFKFVICGDYKIYKYINIKNKCSNLKLLVDYFLNKKNFIYKYNIDPKYKIAYKFISILKKENNNLKFNELTNILNKNSIFNKNIFRLLKLLLFKNKNWLKIFNKIVLILQNNVIKNLEIKKQRNLIINWLDTKIFKNLFYLYTNNENKIDNKYFNINKKLIKFKYLKTIMLILNSKNYNNWRFNFLNNKKILKYLDIFEIDINEFILYIKIIKGEIEESDYEDLYKLLNINDIDFSLFSNIINFVDKRYYKHNNYNQLLKSLNIQINLLNILEFDILKDNTLIYKSRFKLLYKNKINKNEKIIFYIVGLIKIISSTESINLCSKKFINQFHDKINYYKFKKPENNFYYFWFKLKQKYSLDPYIITWFSNKIKHLNNSYSIQNKFHKNILHYLFILIIENSNFLTLEIFYEYVFLINICNYIKLKLGKTKIYYFFKNKIKNDYEENIKNHVFGFIKKLNNDLLSANNNDTFSNLEFLKNYLDRHHYKNNLEIKNYKNQFNYIFNLYIFKYWESKIINEDENDSLKKKLKKILNGKSLLKKSFYKLFLNDDNEKTTKYWNLILDEKFYFKLFEKQFLKIFKQNIMGLLELESENCFNNLFSFYLGSFLSKMSIFDKSNSKSFYKNSYNYYVNILINYYERILLFKCDYPIFDRFKEMKIIFKVLKNDDVNNNYIFSLLSVENICYLKSKSIDKNSNNFIVSKFKLLKKIYKRNFNDLKLFKFFKNIDDINNILEPLIIENKSEMFLNKLENNLSKINFKYNFDNNFLILFKLKTDDNLNYEELFLKSKNYNEFIFYLIENKLFENNFIENIDEKEFYEKYFKIRNVDKDLIDNENIIFKKFAKITDDDNRIDQLFNYLNFYSNRFNNKNKYSKLRIFCKIYNSCEDFSQVKNNNFLLQNQKNFKSNIKNLEKLIFLIFNNCNTHNYSYYYDIFLGNEYTPFLHLIKIKNINNNSYDQLILRFLSQFDIDKNIIEEIKIIFYLFYYFMINNHSNKNLKLVELDFYKICRNLNGSIVDKDIYWLKDIFKCIHIKFTKEKYTYFINDISEKNTINKKLFLTNFKKIKWKKDKFKDINYLNMYIGNFNLSHYEYYLVKIIYIIKYHDLDEENAIMFDNFVEDYFNFTEEVYKDDIKRILKTLLVIIYKIYKKHPKNNIVLEFKEILSKNKFVLNFSYYIILLIYNKKYKLNYLNTELFSQVSKLVFIPFLNLINTKYMNIKFKLFINFVKWNNLDNILKHFTDKRDNFIIKNKHNLDLLKKYLNDDFKLMLNNHTSKFNTPKDLYIYNTDILSNYNNNNKKNIIINNFKAIKNYKFKINIYDNTKNIYLLIKELNKKLYYDFIIDGNTKEQYFKKRIVPYFLFYNLCVKNVLKDKKYLKIKKKNQNKIKNSLNTIMLNIIEDSRLKLNFLSNNSSNCLEISQKKYYMDCIKIINMVIQKKDYEFLSLLKYLLRFIMKYFANKPNYKEIIDKFIDFLKYDIKINNLEIILNIDNKEKFMDKTLYLDIISNSIRFKDSYTKINYILLLLKGNLTYLFDFLNLIIKNKSSSNKILNNIKSIKESQEDIKINKINKILDKEILDLEILIEEYQNLIFKYKNNKENDWNKIFYKILKINIKKENYNINDILYILKLLNIKISYNKLIKILSKIKNNNYNNIDLLNLNKKEIVSFYDHILKYRIRYLKINYFPNLNDILKALLFLLFVSCVYFILYLIFISSNNIFFFILFLIAYAINYKKLFIFLFKKIKELNNIVDDVDRYEFKILFNNINNWLK